MLACAAVARARYFVPNSVLAPIINDPVVTSNVDRLRFESFSGCCGVHARLDVLPDALDGAPLTSGTTNVDFNPAMRAALVNRCPHQTTGHSAGTGWSGSCRRVLVRLRPSPAEVGVRCA